MIGEVVDQDRRRISTLHQDLTYHLDAALETTMALLKDDHHHAALQAIHERLLSAREHDLALQLINDLAETLHSISSQVEHSLLSLAHSLKGASSLAHARKTKRAHERVHALQSTLIQFQKLKHLIDRAHTFALASSLNLDHISPLAQDRILARISGLDGLCRLDLEAQWKQVFAFTNQHAVTFARNGAREHHRIHALVHALERTLSSTLDRSPMQVVKTGDATHHADDQRWLIRGILLALTLYLDDWEGRSSLPLSYSLRNHAFQEAQREQTEHTYIGHAITTYLQLYVTFVMLEQRMQGNIPATEGLLLVKERRKRI